MVTWSECDCKGKGQSLDICYIATYMSQTRDQQRFTIAADLIGMSQWCCSALCGHPLPALTGNWTHCAASRHTIAPISHTRPSPCSRSYHLFLLSSPYCYLSICIIKTVHFSSAHVRKRITGRVNCKITIITLRPKLQSEICHKQTQSNSLLLYSLAKCCSVRQHGKTHNCFIILS